MSLVNLERGALRLPPSQLRGSGNLNGAIALRNPQSYYAGVSPDTRRHRGPHPTDPDLFSDAQVTKLRGATAELSWLLSHGYKIISSLKLVGDRHGLVERQRLAVSRSACSNQSRQQRKASQLPVDQLKDQAAIIDGFNLLITIEAALSKGVLLACRDECIRDLSGVHGSYRSVEETERAISLIGVALKTLGVASVLWLLDKPISNSGRLAAKITAMANSENWPWEVEVVFNPDSQIIASPAIAITSDSSILDQVGRWVELKSYLLAREIPAAWIIDLSSS